jgi:hypothetical protein
MLRANSGFRLRDARGTHAGAVQAGLPSMSQITSGANRHISREAHADDLAYRVCKDYGDPSSCSQIDRELKTNSLKFSSRNALKMSSELHPNMIWMSDTLNRPQAAVK